MTEVASTQNHSNSQTSNGAVDLAPARSAIDASVRPVVVGLIFSGLVWLAVAAILGFFGTIKLHFPDFLNCSFLSYGRIIPASEGAFIFGWCSTAVFAVAIWVVSRLSLRAAPGAWLVSAGAVLWNGGVLIGVGSVLAGRMRPLNGLEFPFGSYALMFAGLCLITTWLVVTYRSEGGSTLAAMFIAGGVAFLGWSLLTGNLLIASGTLKGVMQQVAASWVSSGVLWLWLVPATLGAAYYIVPKVSGFPIHSGPLGRSLFWLYFLVAGLLGASRLLGGPIPLWMGSVSAAAAMLLLVPVIGTAYNLYSTVRHSKVTPVSPSMRFILFGLGILAVVSALNALSVLRSVDYAVHFTSFESGLRSLLVKGSVSMILFGAIYYIMPRLSGCEWLSSSLINLHFLGSAYGSCMTSAMLILSGFATGSALNDAESNFTQVLDLGSSYYWGNTLSYILLIGGYAVFLLHFLLMAVRIGQPAGEPTLLESHNEH